MSEHQKFVHETDSPEQPQHEQQEQTANKKPMSAKIIVLIAWMAMIVVNALANILPINGVGTGEVSDSYPNLFAPAGITFVIWGLIYTLLLVFTIYQFSTPSDEEATVRLGRVRFFFIISSLANIAWIFAWHYRQIAVSTILMLIILVCLIIIDGLGKKQQLTFREKLFVKLPFAVYFGWISVATVANITTLLVDLGWDGFGIADNTWMVVITIVATVIALTVVSTRMNWAYGAVFVWAYAGILIKHLDPAAFNSQYIDVIITVSICLGLIAASSVLALFGRTLRVEKK
ncbi:MAG: hypothetical protein PWP10_3646 [Clostridiales bacterium]|jgi:hypothetical protein|nr:hypothetical protein [Clostridiales bacterium]